ncbi:glutaminyl-peptide cyclotransferase [Skeletonema marinoi]|uniref:Glutaminyl-peptide cyclotransferase n=1 Tax=Skeletonema marinoi TaxID=267567 RepID=A0AAD8XX84_9STRA|nr:glutaminyl-peptide cyclotransferase [Skeletonema marinoi]
MSSVGKTAFILAIVILPTTLLVLLGYVAYHFIGGDSSVPGHAGDNLALDIGEHDAISNEEGKFFNNAGNITINVEEGMVEVAQETQQQTTTTTIATAATTATKTTSQLFPTNIISTAFTAYEQVPHDTTSFTQGLSYGDDGYLYETTGLRGKSKLFKIDTTTFEVIKSTDIDDIYFGEGSTYYTDADGNGRLIFITYEEQTAFIYDPITLTKLQTLSYETTPPWNEGWGITFDSFEGEFILSDGTSTLFFMDRDTLQVKRRIVVTRFDGTEQDDLNELELMGGLICCNIWYADEIICVDKITGRSVREYDLSTLYPKEERGYYNVLNGIALGEDHVLITGKRWDRMYKVRFDDWAELFTGN